MKAERAGRLLWLARTASAAGDALMPIALPFAVLSVNTSASALGSVLAVFWVTRLACTLLGGVVADRLPRRTVMLACDCVRACVEIFAATMLLTHRGTMACLFATAAIFGAASAFFGPAADGLVAQVVAPNKMQQTNASFLIGENTMSVLGPGLAGMLIAFTAVGWVFVIDALTFVVSACFLLQLRAPGRVRAERSPLVGEFRAGFREAMSRGWVRGPIVGFAISNFCFAAFIVLGPVVARERLGGARDWGIISMCGAIGAIVGSVVSARLRPRRPLTVAFYMSSLLGIPLVALAPPLPTPAIGFAWALGMASIAVTTTYWETTLQQRIPEGVLSRVRSYDNFASYVFMPLGLMTFPWIAKVSGSGAALVAAGVVIGLTGVMVAFMPGVRAIGQTPDEGFVQARPV